MSNIDDSNNTNELETSLFFENKDSDDGELRRDEARFGERDDIRGEFDGEEGRFPDGGDLEGGRECGRNRNHRCCCCLGLRGTRVNSGERCPRGILSGGLYLENSCTNPVTLAPNDAVPLLQVRNSIGSGISFVNNTVVVVPGTYYFSWSVLTRSCSPDPNVVITLENIIGQNPRVATSGNLNPQVNFATAINATGSTVVTFNQTAAIRLINSSGHGILLIGANGAGPNNFMASMTVLRLA